MGKVFVDKVFGGNGIKLKVGRNWRAVLKRAWSCWLIYTAILLSASEAAIPYAHDLGWFKWMPGGLFPVVVAVVCGGAIGARILVQDNL